MRLEADITARAGAFTLEAKLASDAGVTALFGRSGSGKTTVLNAIAGLVRPQRGRIRVHKVWVAIDGGPAVAVAYEQPAAPDTLSAPAIH